METANYLKQQLDRQEVIRKEEEKEKQKAKEANRLDLAKKKNQGGSPTGLISNSEVTIYHNALIDGTAKQVDKRNSSSSDEGVVDTSDEKFGRDG